MAILTQEGSYTETGATLWLRRDVVIQPVRAGFHIVTDDVLARLPELDAIKCGVLHVFIKHTSASLSINENVAPEVLDDFQEWFDRAVAENVAYWTHTEEGPDDMPAHVKASLLGSSVTVPVDDGELLLGQYQGIYLCEHRRQPRPRSLVLTLSGQVGASNAGKRGLTGTDDHARLE